MLHLSEKYKAILFITLQNESEKIFAKLAEAIEQESKKYEIEVYFSGVSFGSFDWVIEFEHDSAKSAAYICSEMLENVFQKKIVCSGSFILCKLIENGNEEYNNNALRFYTFLKTDLSKVNDIKKSIVDSDKHIFYFNISQYSIILVTYGDDYETIMESINSFMKKNINIIVEGSTRINLKFNGTSLLKDKMNLDGMNAFINVKLKNISYHDKLLSYIGDKCKIKSERQGWFNVILVKKVQSIRETHDFIMELHDNIPEILHTSTFFTFGGKKSD